MIDIQAPNHKVGCDFFYNDKFLLLTHPKLASSWCRLNVNKDIDLDTYYNLNLFDFSISPGKTLYTTSQQHFSTTKSIWESFLQKKEKRDLIILYRNPFEHFISGFIQDFLHHSYAFNFYTTPFLHYFLDSIQISKKEKDDFLKEYTSSSKGMTFSSYENHKNIWDKIIEIKFDYYINNGNISGNMIQGHYSPWVTFINNLVSSNKIDKNKIKLIDIYDAPLEEQLQHYFSENYFLKINQEKLDEKNKFKNNLKYFTFIKNLINENKNYQNIVYSLLKYEIVYYQKLKKEFANSYNRSII
jgi:hypothetical protein